MTVGRTAPAVELVALIRSGHIAAFIDRATLLPRADVNDALAALTMRERETLQQLLPSGLAAAFPLSASPPSAPRDAAALMTGAFLSVYESDSVELATETVRRQVRSGIDVLDIYVVDVGQRFVGTLSFRQLLLAASTAVVRDVMDAAAPSVAMSDGVVSVTRAMSRHHLGAIAVVDERGRLAGRIATPLSHAPVEDSSARELLRFAGVSVRESDNVTWRVSVRSRLPRLYASLVMTFGAAAVVFCFRGVVARVVSLAIWMPVVAGVGGNAGTQALATMIRRLRREHLDHIVLHRIVLREAVVGILNGAAIGTAVAIVAVLLGERWKLGLVVMLATTCNVLLAGAIAAAAPVWLRRAGRDPSLASPVVISAVMDACGFALLLGLGAWLLM